MMGSIVGSAQNIDASHSSSLRPVGHPRSIIARLASLWPSAVIGLGAVVTIAWAIGLAWLLLLVVQV
jgi:hypothetical protein